VNEAEKKGKPPSTIQNARGKAQAEPNKHKKKNKTPNNGTIPKKQKIGKRADEEATDGTSTMSGNPEKNPLGVPPSMKMRVLRVEKALWRSLGVPLTIRRKKVREKPEPCGIKKTRGKIHQKEKGGRLQNLDQHRKREGRKFLLGKKAEKRGPPFRRRGPPPPPPPPRTQGKNGIFLRLGKKKGFTSYPKQRGNAFESIPRLEDQKTRRGTGVKIVDLPENRVTEKNPNWKKKESPRAQIALLRGEDESLVLWAKKEVINFQTPNTRKTSRCITKSRGPPLSKTSPRGKIKKEKVLEKGGLGRSNLPEEFGSQVGRRKKKALQTKEKESPSKRESTCPDKRGGPFSLCVIKPYEGKKPP